MLALPYSLPRAVELGVTGRDRARVLVLEATVGREAAAVLVEMQQLHTGGVRRLTSLLQDKSFTGPGNLAEWAMELPFTGPAEEGVQELMAEAAGQQRLALEELEFPKSLWVGYWLTSPPCSAQPTRLWLLMEGSSQEVEAGLSWVGRV